MTLTKNDKDYLDKLRRNNPGRNIPTNTEVESALSRIGEKDGEEVVDDLIISFWEGITQFELI